MKPAPSAIGNRPNRLFMSIRQCVKVARPAIILMARSTPKCLPCLIRTYASDAMGRCKGRSQAAIFLSAAGIIPAACPSAPVGPPGVTPQFTVPTFILFSSIETQAEHCNEPQAIQPVPDGFHFLSALLRRRGGYFEAAGGSGRSN